MRPLPPPNAGASGRFPELRQAERAIAGYEPSYYQEPASDTGLDLRELWRIIAKYRLTILLFATIVVITVVAATLIQLPVYRSTTVLEISPQPPSMVQFRNVNTGAEDWFTFRKTQTQIIQSRAVAEAVVKKLNLGDHPAFNGELRQRDLVSGLRELVANLARPALTGLRQLLQGTPEVASPTASAPPKEDGGQARVRALAQAVRGGLEVTTSDLSNLVEISFTSLDRHMAAQVADAVADEYLVLSNAMRFERSAGAEAFLKREITDMQAKLETSEKDLNEFARQNQVVDTEDRSNIMATRLAVLNSDLTKVRSDLIAAQSLAHQVAQTDVNTLPAVVQDERLKELRAKLFELRGEYARLSQTYTDEYPRMQELNRQMEEVRQGLEEAQSNLVKSLEVNFAGLVDREARLALAVEEQKQELLELQDRSIQYQILKREWETNRSLYVALLERVKEVGVVAGMERAVGSVIDRALVPTVPSGPYLRNNLMKALLFGLLGGVGLAFLLNLLDNTVRDPEDVGRLTSLANLGVVPSIDIKALPAGTMIELLSHSHRDHSLSEAFRSVRTSLMFSAAGGAPKLLMVASSVPGEGKSTTTVNLGIVLAHTGASVLLVDADLRKPRLHRVFKVPRGPGLTELLVQEGVSGVFYATGIDNLTLLTAGTPPPNPAELLSSSTSSHLFEELARRYDYVIVDTSPIMGLADPIALSTKVSGVLLVSAAGKVGRSALREAVKRLRAVDATLLGSVLNRVERHSSQYAYYTSYYYNYNYGASDKRDLSEAA